MALIPSTPPPTDPNPQAWERLQETFDGWAREGTAALMREGHSHLGLTIASELPAGSSDTILDLSCGEGWFTRHLATEVVPDGHVIGVDLSPGMIDEASAVSDNPGNVRFEVANAEELPFEDKSIDHIASIESFYYFPNQVSAGHEMFRVLKPGGTFFVAMHYFLENPWSHQWRTYLDVSMHCKGTEQYNTLFRACGFIDVGDQRIREEGDLPQKIDGKWFTTLEQLKNFREEGALLISGRRPPEEE
ncbi:class I SAM-dependent methyltransferase [Gemmatimonadota bacterium]